MNPTKQTVKLFVIAFQPCLFVRPEVAEAVQTSEVCIQFDLRLEGLLGLDGRNCVHCAANSALCLPHSSTLCALHIFHILQSAAASELLAQETPKWASTSFQDARNFVSVAECDGICVGILPC